MLRHLIFLTPILSFAMGGGSVQTPGCLNENMKGRVLDAFLAHAQPHSSHGKSFALYEVDKKGRAIKGKSVEYRAHKKRAVASTQKVLSAYLAFKESRYVETSLSYSYYAKRIDINSGRSPSSGYVRNDDGNVASIGDRISLHKTLRELLRKSANGAGHMIAENFYINKVGKKGSLREIENYYSFHAQRFARDILGKNMVSHFSNPHGLDYYEGINRTEAGSTASELSRLFSGLAVKKGRGGKRFDHYLQSFPGTHFQKGLLYKHGSTRRAGKTYISLYDSSYGTCRGRRFTMALFGGGDSSWIGRAQDSIIKELAR